jgi:hypothetical protein
VAQRTLAEQELERFHLDLRDALEEATGMLDEMMMPIPAGAVSDGWFETAERLHDSCRRLGAVRYCLYEWEEPSDDAADIEDDRHRGRRNVPVALLGGAGGKLRRATLTLRAETDLARRRLYAPGCSRPQCGQYLTFTGLSRVVPRIVVGRPCYRVERVASEELCSGWS